MYQSIPLKMNLDVTEQDIVHDILNDGFHAREMPYVLSSFLFILILENVSY